MNLPRLLSRPWITAALAFFVICALGYIVLDKGVLPWVAGRFKSTVDVPSLSGQTPDQARPALEAIGLQLSLDSTGDFNDTIAAGSVYSQLPPSGTTVKEGRRVWVRISKGPRSVTVPSLRGKSLRQAEITLQQAGLEVGKVREVRHPGIPAGAVIATHPKVGTVMNQRKPVDIQVSVGTGSGGGSAKIPSFVGMSLAKAQTRLQELDLKAGTVKKEKAEKKLPKTVIRQSPAAGSPLTPGQEIHLTIAQ
jgi:serine/threonine-protein kinase